MVLVNMLQHVCYLYTIQCDYCLECTVFSNHCSDFVTSHLIRQYFYYSQIIFKPKNCCLDGCMNTSSVGTH